MQKQAGATALASLAFVTGLLMVWSRIPEFQDFQFSPGVRSPSAPEPYPSERNPAVPPQAPVPGERGPAAGTPRPGSRLPGPALPEPVPGEDC